MDSAAQQRTQMIQPATASIAWVERSEERLGFRFQLMTLATVQLAQHYGLFATLRDVVDYYNTFFGLKLTEGEIRDLIQYLLSL